MQTKTFAQQFLVYSLITLSLVYCLHSWTRVKELETRLAKMENQLTLQANQLTSERIAHAKALTEWTRVEELEARMFKMQNQMAVQISQLKADRVARTHVVFQSEDRQKTEAIDSIFSPIFSPAKDQGLYDFRLSQ